jgi:voltage-gated potassium channel
MRIPAFLRAPRDSRNRYRFLLIWLVAYLLGDAIAFELGGSTRLVDFVFAGVLFSTLRMLSRNPREFAVATSLGGLAVVAAALSAISPSIAFLAAKAVLASAFCGFLSFVILREVLQADQVDADTIRGAVCAYLFVGISWAGAYAFVELLSPGSLTLPAAAHGAASGEARPESLLYFSFVTLATLGYGDILPTTPVTRALAWMEAVFGQFYIAVLVARLVGLMQMRRRDGRER